jgi:peroxiredoxin
MKIGVPKSIVCSLSFCGALVAACGSSAPPPPSQPSPIYQRVMPTFEGQTLSQNTFDSGQGGGHKMVVNFFSSDSKECKTTLPALERIYEGESNLVVVGVCEDESAAKARELVTGLGLSFPVVHDPKGSVARLYEVEGKPATFVITPRGRVSWVGGAAQTEDVLRAALHAASD